MRHTNYKTRDIRLASEKRSGGAEYAFTLVEILIVVAIIGILAAIVLPTLQGHIQQTKESVAKDNLRILRSIIEVYAARHNSLPPGYPDNNPSLPPAQKSFSEQMTGNGSYLPTIPTNPFSGASIIKMIVNSEDFPTKPVQPINFYGWVYKPATKTIRVNWPGTDSAGVAYFDY